jgi:hypothetical protein
MGEFNTGGRDHSVRERLDADHRRTASGIAITMRNGASIG